MTFLRSLLGLSQPTQAAERDRVAVRDLVALHAPPSPRIRKEFARSAVRGIYTKEAYGIIATQYEENSTFGAPQLELYIRTCCPAIAKYILFEHDPVENWPVWQIPSMDPASEEHKRWSLRMLRCGAITVKDTHGWRFSDEYYALPEVCEHYDNYLFGWPDLVDGRQPVWMYQRPARVPDVLSSNDPAALRLDFIRKQLTDLEASESMKDYCEQLRLMGGTYFEDVEACPTAHAAGIVYPMGLMSTVPKATVLGLTAPQDDRKSVITQYSLSESVDDGKGSAAQSNSFGSHDRTAKCIRPLRLLRVLFRTLRRLSVGQKFATQQTFERYKQQVLKVPASPRFDMHHESHYPYDCDIYTISAVLYSTVDSFDAPRPSLYIRTRRAAVAKYILFEHDEIKQWPPNDINSLKPDSAEHKNLCLRMRRCGAIEGDVGSLIFDERYYHMIEVWSSPENCLFGWPTRSMDGLQPVWVYKCQTNGDMGLDTFAECDTMEQYCTRLENIGAVYYTDMQQSAEAHTAGVVS